MSLERASSPAGSNGPASSAASGGVPGKQTQVDRLSSVGHPGVEGVASEPKAKPGASTQAEQADAASARAAAAMPATRYKYPGWPGWPGGKLLGEGMRQFARGAEHDYEIHWRAMVFAGNVYLRAPLGSGDSLYVGMISERSTPENPIGVPGAIAAIDLDNGLINGNLHQNGWGSFQATPERYQNGDNIKNYTYRDGQLVQKGWSIYGSGESPWVVVLEIDGTIVPKGSISELNGSGIFSSIAHTFLDLASLVPGVGAVAAIANVCLDIAQGKNWKTITIDGLAAIPGDKAVEIGAWAAEHLAQVKVATDSIGAFVVKHEINTADRIYALYDAAKNIQELGEKYREQHKSKFR